MSPQLARLLRRSLSTSPSPSPNPKSLHSLYHEPNLDAFLSRFDHLSSASSSPLPISIYAVASRRLAAAGRTSDAARLLDSLGSRLPSGDSSSASLVSLYAKAGLPDRALDTFRRLPSPLTFNALLSSLDPDAVVHQFHALPLAHPDLKPDVAAYTSFMRALSHLGDIDDALGCLRMMDDAGVEPNDATYNTLLNALYKTDRAEEADGIWQKMVEKGRGPTVRSFNAKLRWLISKGRTADAVQLFQEIESTGLKPDGYSITALIVGHCKDGNLKQGKILLEELRRRKCEPTPWMYDALVRRMCEEGELDSALSLCNESLKNRCYASTEVLQLVANGLAAVGRIADARKLVETAWSRHSYSRENLIIPAESSASIEVENHVKLLKEVEDKVCGDLVVPGSVSGREEVLAQTEEEVKPSGAAAKIGIIVKSFDKPKYMGAFGVPLDKNRVKLPTTRSLITVLRSPHIDKKSREQFEMKVRREYITIKCQPHELNKKYFWFKRTRILGAQFELVFSYKTRLDMSRLKQCL